MNTEELAEEIVKIYAARCYNCNSEERVERTLLKDTVIDVLKHAVAGSDVKAVGDLELLKDFVNKYEDKPTDASEPKLFSKAVDDAIGLLARAKDLWAAAVDPVNGESYSLLQQAWMLLCKDKYGVAYEAPRLCAKTTIGGETKCPYDEEGLVKCDSHSEMTQELWDASAKACEQMLRDGDEQAPRAVSEESIVIDFGEVKLEDNWADYVKVKGITKQPKFPSREEFEEAYRKQFDDFPPNEDAVWTYDYLTGVMK